MDNPYWSSDGQKHHVDLEAVRLLCFELVSIFEASRSLADGIESQESEEEVELTEADVPLVRLHQRYAFVQASKALLQLALMVRTYDDQMRESDRAEKYAEHVGNVDDVRYSGVLIGIENLSFREACNKIIHAQSVRPLYERVDRTVTNALETGKIGQDIWYLTGEVELSGLFRKARWELTLFLQPFLEVILDVVAFGNPEN